MVSTTTDRQSGSKDVAIKGPVVAATTASITLSGAQTIDGVSCVAGDRVLVKDQSTTTQNGIYKVATGSWTRVPDFDGTGDSRTGTLVFVTGGSSNANTFWRVSTASNPDPGEAMAFSQVNFPGTIDINSFAAETSPDATADFLALYDTSEGDENKITPENFLKVINGLTAETSPASGDFLPMYDISGSATDKITLANMMKVINDLTAETSIATDDVLPIYDTSGSSTDKMTVENFLKVVNVLTTDASPDTSADYVMTYDTSAALPKKALLSSVGTAGLVLIQEQTASASATIDFITGISSTYEHYILDIIDLVPATDNTSPYLRFSTDGGSTFRSSGGDYYFGNNGFLVDGGITSGPTGNNAATQIELTNVQSNVGNSSEESFSCTIHIYNPAGSRRKPVNYFSSYVGTATEAAFAHGAGLLNTLSAVNGLRILMSSGNITSGKFKLYGVKKS